MDEQRDWYLIEGTREELLEMLYQLFLDVDAIASLKDELDAEGSMNEWGLLSALEYSLRKSQAPVK